MKLSKSQVEKICEDYSLGKLKSYKLSPHGYVNYSFIIKTDERGFVAQFFKHSHTKWKRKRLNLELEVLNYLKKKKFPYAIPQPIKNKRGGYFSHSNKKLIWVYPLIEGNIVKSFTKKQFQEFAKVVALYHKYISPLGTKGDDDFINFDWLLDKFDNLKKIKSKKKIDKLMLENIDYFQDIVRKLKKINYGKMILTHSDFSESNTILKNGKIIGIIDFDNIKAAPIANDLAISMTRTDNNLENLEKEKEKAFLKEYEKIKSLSKKDKELIIPCILKEYCTVFWWFYEGMDKHRDRAYNHMKDVLKNTKKLMKEWEGVG